MTGSLSPSIETLRTLVQRRLEHGSEPDLAILTRAAIEAVEGNGSALLPSLWAACREGQDDPLVVRLASFLIARYSGELEGNQWVPLLWLLAPPYAQDESTLQNTLTALQRNAAPPEPARAFIQREVGPLLLHALTAAPRLLESVADVVLALADSSALRTSLRARDAKRLLEQLRTLATTASSAVAEAAESAASAVASGGYVDDFPSLAADVRERLTQSLVLAKSATEDATLGWTNQSVREFLEQYATLEELTDETATRRIPAHDIRITGGWATVGKLPIDFLERVLHTWRKLYGDIRAAFAGDHLAPDLFVLAPARGSFIVRVLVDTEQPAFDGQAAEAFVDIATGFGNRASGLTAEARDQWLAESFPLVKLAADNGVDIEVSLAIPGPLARRHRIRIGHRKARRTVEAVLAEASDTVADRQEIVGVLDGANHRTGHFEMLPEDGTPAITGNVARPGRNILLNKTIGGTYRFEIRRVIEANGADKWELHRVSSVTGEPLVAPATRDVLAPPPEVITSTVLPQTDSLERITQVVEVVASGAILSEETVDLSARHIAYHTHAARCLHLLTEEGLLSEAGAILVTLPSTRRLDHLAIQFEVSIPGHAWIRWANATGVDDLDPKSASQFLKERSNLTPSMVERRGRTLTSWAKQLQKRNASGSTPQP